MLYESGGHLWEGFDIDRPVQVADRLLDIRPDEPLSVGVAGGHEFPDEVPSDAFDRCVTE